jgi:hypothetical protein
MKSKKKKRQKQILVQKLKTVNWSNIAFWIKTDRYEHKITDEKLIKEHEERLLITNRKGKIMKKSLKQFCDPDINVNLMPTKEIIEED